MGHISKRHYESKFCDISDKSYIEDITKNKEIVIHLAALIGIPYSYTARHSYLNTNLSGTFNILEACLKNNVSQLIHTSTSEVYGTAIKIPMNENHRLFPQSPYAASKASADLIVNSFYSSFNLPIITLRPFNTFGPRQSPRAVIPTIIKQFISNQVNLSLGNINTSRDFTYVLDTVKAFEVALKSKKYGEVFNIGSNFSIKISQIINLCSKEFNIKKKIQKDAKKFRPQNSEVMKLFCSNLKSKKYLKWKPQYTGLNGFKKALKTSIDWYKKNKNLYLSYSKKIV